MRSVKSYEVVVGAIVVDWGVYLLLNVRERLGREENL